MIDDPIQRLTKDLREASRKLGRREVRYLVDAYYQMQEDRKRANNQVRAMSEDGEPCAVIEWLGRQTRMLEQQIKLALDYYSRSHPLGRWARSIKGIGPVIAAGLLAHIDLERAPTVGHIWRYAGLDPTVRWERGQKRPWNARLKTLCWKIGESFVKVSGKPDAYYGQVYLQRKAYEQERNERGEYREQALERAKQVGRNTEAYKWYSKGMLPPAHIHARAKRYAVKLFLAHYHEMGYRLMGKEPPLPYPIAVLGHAHYIRPEDAS